MSRAEITRARLGILVSGRGSNMVALADACAAGSIDADVALVVSNVAAAPALERAGERGIATEVLDHRGVPREQHDARVTAALEHAAITHVCLAGYMRLLSASFVRRWEGRILNVHPSLLPAFPGVDAQRQAVEHGARISGCTVHFVDEDLDHGPIILQQVVSVEDDDTAESLSARILEVEHEIYPRAVALVVSGRVRIEGRRVIRI
jgi:phosphoribosylglycinamide formyltransferase-1